MTRRRTLVTVAVLLCAASAQAQWLGYPAKHVPRNADGTPATVDNVRDVLGKGVRYIYTHLPRLLGTGAGAFLKAGRPGVQG